MDSGFFNVCAKYMVLALVFIFISTVLYYASTDPASLSSKTYIYIFTLVLPLILAFAYIQNMTPFGSDISSTYFFISTCISILFFTIAIYYYQYSKNLFLVSYLINIIVFMIIVVALAIVFNLFSNYLAKMEGIAGLIIHFIFYIPCLFNDFLEFLKNQYKLTSNTVLILFLLEIVFLIIYFYIPVFVEKIILSSGKSLLNEPVFLDKGNTNLAMDTDLLFSQPKIPVSVYDKSPDHHLKNYSISMWVFVNQDPPSHSFSTTNEITIFDYGYKEKSTNYVKPRITYNQLEQCFHFYFTTYKDVEDAGDIGYKIHVKNQFNSNKPNIPIQKWNNFVFNYYDNRADLYINGVLQRTFEYNDNLPTYNSNDTISIGDSKNKLNGAICNIMYYNKNLSKHQIANLYNIIKLNNPPIVKKIY